MCTRQLVSRPTVFTEKQYRISDLLDRFFQGYLIDPCRKLYLEEKHMEAANKIMACRSKKLGYAVLACTGCGEVRFIYRSCKHRFCSGCGAEATIKWAGQTLSRLLNMKHNHIVMTLPKALRGLSKKNGDKLHDILFKVSSEVIQSWFEHRHGLRPGIVSVLHTAGSDLKYHPHVHMIVSSGGQCLETGEYNELAGDYLVSQRFLGHQLKLRFRKALELEVEAGRVELHPKIQEGKAFKKWFKSISDRHWIVSIQKPLEDVEQIVKYVGRYTKRACLSEYKIEEVSETHVTIRYNDYKNTPQGAKPVQGKIKLGITEFLDKLLQHVPTKRYRMVRYYGTYNSYHLNRIPEAQRWQQGNQEQLQEAANQLRSDKDWGLFEGYRKCILKLGKEDPLYCKNCEKDYILYAIFYKDEKKNQYIYDSS